MTSFDLLKRKRSFHLGFDVVPPYMLLGILLLLSLLIWINDFIRAQQDIPLSVADALAFLSGNLFPLRLFCIPVFLFYVQQSVRSDFIVSIVTRRKDRRSIWNVQCFRLLVSSFLFVAFIGLCGLWSAQSCFGEEINWHQYHSNYYFNTGAVNADVSFLQLLLAYFISLWLQLFGGGLLFLLLLWSVRSVLVPWPMIMAIVIWDKYISRDFTPKPLFFDWMQITFHEWNRQVIPRNFIIAFLLILALYIIGWTLSRRKEFYG